MCAEKKSAANSGKDSFESDLAKLEKLVAALEEGEVTLDELLTKYEEGMRLLKSCQASLQAAQLRIEQLGKRPDDEQA